ncbi:MAG TPA: hypothetical protein PLU81_05730 [Deltaproteobacteria bacterium]|nr:hypothetical protein [Deltaproteobacteria bacterium]
MNAIVIKEGENVFDVIEEHEKEYGVGIYQYSIIALAEECFSHIETLADLLKNNDSYELQALGHFTQEVIDHQAKKLHDALATIRNTHGEYSILYSRDNNNTLTKGEIITLAFKPNKPMRIEKHSHAECLKDLIQIKVSLN